MTIQEREDIRARREAGYEKCEHGIYCDKGKNICGSSKDIQALLDALEEAEAALAYAKLMESVAMRDRDKWKKRAQEGGWEL